MSNTYRKSDHEMTLAEIREYYLPYGESVVAERIEYLRQRNRARKAERKEAKFDLTPKEEKTLRRMAKTCECCARPFHRQDPGKLAAQLGHKYFPACIVRYKGLISFPISDWEVNGIILCSKCNNAFGYAEHSLDSAFTILERAGMESKEACSILWPIWQFCWNSLWGTVTQRINQDDFLTQWEDCKTQQDFDEAGQRLTRLLVGLNLGGIARDYIRKAMPK